jgi:hypothetical protein
MDGGLAFAKWGPDAAKVLDRNVAAIAGRSSSLLARTTG